MGEQFGKEVDAGERVRGESGFFFKYCFQG